MYIERKLLDKRIRELATLDLISRQDVEQTVSGYINVAARVEHVAIVIANLREEFRRVEQYEWHVRDFSINIDEPREDMQHLVNVAVTVRLYAVRKEDNEYEDRLAKMGRGGIEDDNVITRQVKFPIRYLTSDDWIDEARREAKRSHLWLLKYMLKSMPETIEERNAEVEGLRKKAEDMAKQITEIEGEGIVVDV